jgi:hypothetical protein
MQDNVCHIKEMETYHRNNPATWNYHYDSIGNLTRDLGSNEVRITGGHHLLLRLSMA